jgi:hypothetical protein
VQGLSEDLVIRSHEDPHAATERLLERLVALLGDAGERVWRSTLQTLLDEVRAARGDDVEYQRVLRRILRLYIQGMRGFGDLVLQTSDHVLPEQKEFTTLRQRLFDVVRDQLV